MTDLPRLPVHFQANASLPPRPDLAALAEVLGLHRLEADLGFTRRERYVVQPYPVTGFFVQARPGDPLDRLGWAEITERAVALPGGPDALDKAARSLMDLHQVPLILDETALDPLDIDDEPLHLSAVALGGALYLRRELFLDELANEAYADTYEAGTLTQDILDQAACLVVAAAPSAHARIAATGPLSEATALFEAEYGARLREMFDLAPDTPLLRPTRD